MSTMKDNRIPMARVSGNRRSWPLLTQQQQRERDEALVKLYLSEPVSVVEAAKRMGLSRSRAGEVLRLYGVSRPVGRPTKADINQAFEREVEQAYRRAEDAAALRQSDEVQHG